VPIGVPRPTRQTRSFTAAESMTSSPLALN
jgi:hypothetical protein